jgi:hypothetical protein
VARAASGRRARRDLLVADEPRYCKPLDAARTIQHYEPRQSEDRASRPVGRLENEEVQPSVLQMRTVGRDGDWARRVRGNSIPLQMNTLRNSVDLPRLQARLASLGGLHMRTDKRNLAGSRQPRCMARRPEED